MWGTGRQSFSGVVNLHFLNSDFNFPKHFHPHQLNNMDPLDTHDDRPSKRVKLEEPAIELSKDQREEEAQLQKELNAGITCYVSPNTPGFSGILKQRLVLSNS